MTLGPAVQKLVAVLLLAAVAFAAWGGVISPLKHRFEQHERTANQSRLLIERYRRILAQASVLKAEIVTIGKSRVLKDGLLVAPSAELGAALLQGKIKNTSTASAAKLISIQVLAPKPEADFTRVAVRARIKGDIAALQRVLHDLETAWPSLVIDNVNIRARTRRTRRVKGAPATLRVEPGLSIRFDAYGFMAMGSPASIPGAAGAKEGGR